MHFRHALVVATVLALTGVAWSSPMTFTVAPGNTPTNDDAWKASALGLTAGNYHVEENFESFHDKDSVFSLVLGGVTAAIQTGGSPGGQIFKGFFGAQPPGTINGNALLNTNIVGGIDQTTFTFSGDPVQGFGVWIFDDASNIIDEFTMTAETMDGGRTFFSHPVEAPV